MIRLRELIERGRRHRVLGPVLIVLLLVVLALMIVHEGHESTGADLGVLCIGIALLLIAALLPPPKRLVSAPVPETERGRAPPARVVHRLTAAACGGSRSLPLRL